MASYRPFPPQSSFAPPIQSTLPPQPQQAGPQPTQQRGNQYNQNWNGYGGDVPIPTGPSSFNHNYTQMHPNSNSNSHQQHYGPPGNQHPPPPPPHQQFSYPPPPPPDSSYPPPPPPSHSAPQNSMNSQPPQPSMYYPSSQYSQRNQNHQPTQPIQPPPPPSSPPPNSSIPPPPPPNSPPPPPSAPPPRKDIGPERGRHEYDKRNPKDTLASGRRGNEHSDLGKQQKPPALPMPVKRTNGPSGRVETEEEKRLRKKKEFEKQRQEEKHKQQLRDSQNMVTQKSVMMLSSGKGHESFVGSRMGDRRATPLLNSERAENRLKKPTTFLCKLKFRNELPDTSAQPKLMTLKKDKDHYTKYTITTLEKMYKPQLYVEPDLGIPLDLLDLSVYNPPSVRPLLELEDEELLHDDVAVTPVKKDGIKRKERPTDKGMAWLVKTQYISPLSIESSKQSLTEKQAKELREMKGGHNLLENLNNRERQIKEIEASFEACKSRPVHATNKNLYPVEVLPLLPDFDRYDDQFVTVAFDSAPTADSENYGKLEQSIRDAYESRAIMKSYMASGPDPANSEKFLAYMAPCPDELSKDMYDEHEDVSFSWVREYHWDVRGDDADDPNTYVVSFDKAQARYLPLPTKLVLRKKRAKEGRSIDEVEHFPVPARVTVRRRPTVAAVELKEAGDYSNSKGTFSNLKRRLDIDDDGLERSRKFSLSP